jgi:hypothetical protein
MSPRHRRNLALAFVFCLPVIGGLQESAAHASSSFVITGKPKVKNRGRKNEVVQVPIAYAHWGSPDMVSFHLHKGRPFHSCEAVRKGPLVARLEFQANGNGATPVTLSVPRAALDKLGLTPGAEASLAFVMEGIGHRWGTAGGQRTQFVVPNSRFARLSRPRSVFCARLRNRSLQRLRALRGWMMRGSSAPWWPRGSSPVLRTSSR